MTNDTPIFKPEDIRAQTLLYGHQLRYLMDEAEHQTKHGQVPILQAIAQSLVEPLESLDRVAQPLRGLYAQVDTPEREATREKAQEQLDEMTSRIGTAEMSRYAPHNMVNETEDEDQSVYLMSAVLNILATNTAAIALAQRAHDQAAPLDERWAHVCALYEAVKISQSNTHDPTETTVLLKELPGTHDMAWIRLNKLMEDEMEQREPLYQAAFEAVCRSSGVTKPSGASAAFPDAVRQLVQNPVAGANWELGAWEFEINEFDLLEVIRFDHDGERHVKTIHEPYPDGYPAALVKDQMIDLFEALDENSDSDDPEFYVNFATANAMYEAAAQDLHTASYENFDMFMENLREELEDDFLADCIFRSITGRNRNLGRLMTPPDAVPPRLANREQTAAILTAARATGMTETQLWELALVLGSPPKEHDIPTPKLTESAEEFLHEADTYGIPQITGIRWSQLLDTK